jgi:hypothetical protein
MWLFLLFANIPKIGTETIKIVFKLSVKGLWVAFDV